MEELSGEMELQIDDKPQGVVLRLNDENRCILRICRIPRELVYDEKGNLRKFIDVTYPDETIKKIKENNPKTYVLKIYSKFKITGRGTVFSVHRDENDKSTEFMLEYMQSFANVDLDCVLNYLQNK